MPFYSIWTLWFRGKRTIFYSWQSLSFWSHRMFKLRIIEISKNIDSAPIIATLWLQNVILDAFHFTRYFLIHWNIFKKIIFENASKPKERKRHSDQILHHSVFDCFKSRNEKKNILLLLTFILWLKTLTLHYVIVHKIWLIRLFHTCSVLH